MDYFKDKTHPCIKKIKNAVLKTFYNNSKKCNLQNLHSAMVSLEETLNMPIPSLEESIESVIVPERIEELIEYLKWNNVAGFMLSVGWIRKILVDGAYKNYLSTKNNAFFNLVCDYNLTQLQFYIEGGVDKDGYSYAGLVGLLEDYKEIMKEINELK